MNYSLPDEISNQRMIDLQKLAARYQDPIGVLQFLTQMEKGGTTHHTGIEPVIYTRGRDRMGSVTPEQAQFLGTQIEAVCRESTSYLVIVPEFSLYSKHTAADPLSFDDKGNVVGGQETATLAFNQIKEMARKYGKTIVLSSFCEKRTLANGLPALFNTTAIISSNGDVNFRRKLSEIFVQQGDQFEDMSIKVQETVRYKESDRKYSDPLMNELIELTYGTAKPMDIKGKDGSTHKLVVIVCQERAFQPIYDHLPLDIDIIAVPISEGDLSTNRDIASVIAYGESSAIRQRLEKRLGGGEIHIALTNERTNTASVITYAENGTITNILLR